MFKKTYRRYLRLKIYRQEKKIKKLWTYKHPNKLFVIGRRQAQYNSDTGKGNIIETGKCLRSTRTKVVCSGLTTAHNGR
jgi:hypothetical protein